MYTDAHVHLSSESFDEVIEDVLKRAFDAQVRSVCNVATTSQELLKALSYAKQFFFIDFKQIAGVPPQNVDRTSVEEYTCFKKYAETGVLSAIGEIGLDYYPGTTKQEKHVQREVLIKYLQLAVSVKLPIVVHCRNAFKDFFSILEDYYEPSHNSCKGMLHCFTGNQEDAQQLIDYDWLISISGIVSFKNSDMLRNVVSTIPLRNLVAETDAPWLAPVPMRGKLNEPAFLLHTVDVIGNIKNVSLKLLLEEINKNLSRFFA